MNFFIIIPKIIRTKITRINPPIPPVCKTIGDENATKIINPANIMDNKGHNMDLKFL